MRTRSRGFTLIEMLVVISIIATLSSVVIVSTTNARDAARMAAGKQFESQLHHSYALTAVGLWDFDEGSGGYAYNSAAQAANQYRATLDGQTWVEGVNAGALHFNGATGMLVSSTAGDILENRADRFGGATAGKVLFSAWVKRGEDSAQNLRGIAYAMPGMKSISIVTSTGKLRVCSDVVGSMCINFHSNGSIPVGKWTHIAVLFEAGRRVQMYIDGSLDTVVNSSSIGIYGNSSAAYIGVGISAGASPFVGEIDSVRLYYPVF